MDSTIESSSGVNHPEFDDTTMPAEESEPTDDGPLSIDPSPSEDFYG